MPDKPHPLLLRQLLKLGIGAGASPDALPDALPDAATFAALLTRISAVYDDVDQERYLLERSQAISSQEMATLNQALKASQAHLASLLSLSTDWVWEQDGHGRFRHVSETLLERTGLDQAVLLGQPCTEDGLLRVPVADLQLLRALQAAQRPFHDINFEVTSPAGRQWHMSISGEPLFVQGHFTGYRGVGRDVTAAVEADRASQQHAREALESQLNFSSRLLEVNPTPMFVKDVRGRFVTVNPAWLELTGLALAAVVGRNSSELFGEQGPMHTEHDDRLLQSEDRVRYENRLEMPGHPPRDTVVTKVRFTQADGSPAGIIGSIVDVTEFREAERATREARDAAESANLTKSEFIANISHELRTPLQSIIGYSELGAARAANQPRWQEMFKDIHAGGQRMLTLVNGLLDLSKAGDMSATLLVQPHDLAMLVDEVAREMWPIASQRGVHIELHHEHRPLVAVFDDFRIQQVVRNVLANALRFGPPGSCVQINTGPDALRPGGAQITVRDHGPGVPPGELESIFDPFVQSSRTRDGAGGTGLGLTICRKIMTLHGGSITAANVDVAEGVGRAEGAATGGGALMCIRLPAAP
jgi:PAS domain S-box-containing protein